MFLFAESSGENAARLEAEFRERQAEADYESKIANLLRRAYRRERRLPDGPRQWKQALRAIRGEDFYGLVMLEAAGLPVSSEPGLWHDIRTLLPYAGATLLFGSHQGGRFRGFVDGRHPFSRNDQDQAERTYARNC